MQAGYNLLMSIPGDLGTLTSLSELHLAGNKLETLPPGLGRALPPAGSLVDLAVGGNPFRPPLSQIVLRGTAAALRYLREQL